MKVTMRREAAAQYGLTAAAVGAAVRAELTGATATTVTIDNQELDVVVRGDGAASRVWTPCGPCPSPPAGAVMYPSPRWRRSLWSRHPQSINRTNQSRVVTITGDTISNTTQITKQITNILDGYTMPEGLYCRDHRQLLRYDGELPEICCWRCWWHWAWYTSFWPPSLSPFAMPVIVMMILPVAFTGALFALPVTGRDLSMISLVALIMLAGTVVNSSIILVEYIKIPPEHGREPGGGHF